MNVKEFHSMATPKNPLISEKNSKLRLEFARGHIDKGISGIVFYLMMKVNMKFWKTMGVQKVWRVLKILQILLNMVEVM